MLVIVICILIIIFSAYTLTQTTSVEAKKKTTDSTKLKTHTNTPKSPSITEDFDIEQWSLEEPKAPTKNPVKTTIKRSSLKNAIIMKEILDKPLALRKKPE